eukprot:TRINITY_DN14130_c0_g2_i1.p1 TRINITY_DN14130_c0_g2~~TRINITY_DN14130_c0_g2_i1.p1  ORF type:complete len:301 (+),score=24.41 TRINITY_DN14130_c0_g2_i1:95-997(+)
MVQLRHVLVCRSKHCGQTSACDIASTCRRTVSTVIAGSLALLVAFSLQGCDVGSSVEYLVSVHGTATWESKPSYFTRFTYLPEGKPISQGVLNSCEVNLTKSEQCSGNGVCVPWNTTSAIAVPLRFCLCGRDWADPECRTKRKSQMVAFLLSLFGGFLGLDLLYLGQYMMAFLKLATVGGLGLWWTYDIVRIGSSPVYAEDARGFRLAMDLPHPMFVLLVVLFGAAMGYLVFGVMASTLRRKRQMSKMMLDAEQEFFRTASAVPDLSGEGTMSQPIRSNYPYPRPVPQYRSATPGGRLLP